MAYLKVDIIVKATEQNKVLTKHSILLNEESVLSYLDGKITLKPGCNEVLEKELNVEIDFIVLISSPDHITSQIVK